MIKIHPTAIIEDNVTIGEGTSVWDSVHIRHGATIGEDCIVGEKTYIAYDVSIGNLVKINAMVYICAAVTIEDGVMISASVTFTNDRFPRATLPDLKTLRGSEPDEHTLPTLVRKGATIGAGCTIGNDLEIGRWAMVGMGSIVTKSVPDFHLVLGSPARSIGAVCKCGQLFHRFSPEDAEEFDAKCSACGLEYEITNSEIREKWTEEDIRDEIEKIEKTIAKIVSEFLQSEDDNPENIIGFGFGQLLSWQLRLSDWENRKRWIDGMMHERIIGKPQNKFFISGEMVWGLRSDIGGKQWREPFEAEGEISQDGQNLVSYTIKFANDKPIEEKVITGDNYSILKDYSGEYKYVFQK